MGPTPLRWIAHKILPLVYDESLSYYELLCKVVAKINEVIAYVDEVMVERIRELVSALVLEYAYDETTETLTITLDVADSE